MACLGGSLAPGSDCTLQLAECFGLSAAERGATREVWSKGNEALVFGVPKNVSWKICRRCERAEIERNCLLGLSAADASEKRVPIQMSRIGAPMS